jgi:hypothetical protein
MHYRVEFEVFIALFKRKEETCTVQCCDHLMYVS